MRILITEELISFNPKTGDPTSNGMDLQSRFLSSKKLRGEPLRFRTETRAENLIKVPDKDISTQHLAMGLINQ